MLDQKSNSIIENTARNIDKLRTEKGLSFRDLADKAGVSLATIHNIIQCKKIPNIYTLHSICTALEVSLSDFFNQDEQVLMLRGKESILIKIYRELSPMSQDTLIKLAKCMK